MSSIGDILQCFGLVDLIRKHNPVVQIDWLVEKRFEGIVQSHPHVDRVIGIDTKAIRSSPLPHLFPEIMRLKKLEYDVLFDLQGNIKSGLVIAMIKAKEKVGYAKNSVPEWPNLFSTNRRYPIDLTLPIIEQYASLVKQYYKDESKYTSTFVKMNLCQAEINWLTQTDFEIPYNAIMIAVGSQWRNKRLKKSHLISLLRSLEQEIDAHFIFVWHSEDERIQAEQLHMLFESTSQTLGGISIPLLQTLMAKCKALICTDSAILHLASLIRIKTFAFFGPSNSAVYNPSGKQHQAYQGICPYNEVFEKRCRHLRTCVSGDCLAKMDVEGAYKAIRHWLSGVMANQTS